MNNNPLDDIVKCNIEISSPASNEETFDTILMVTAGPTSAGERTMDKVTAISKADELLEYGYTVDDPVYEAALVAFSQSPSPDELYICIRKETDISEGETPAEGESVKVYEDIRVTLARALAESGFYGTYLVDFRDQESITGAIEWAEANEKLFAFEYTDYEALPVKNFSYYRSFCMYSGSADGYGVDEQPKENRYAALAWMAKCFGYDPGTETWHLKELAAVVPSVLSTNQKRELESNHMNTFRRYAGCNVTIGGYTLAGEWIDVIRFRDWLKAEMQTNVFNALKTNRKVPFTDAGIGLIEGKMEETLLKGQTIGGIAEDEYGDEDNVTRGFTVTVPQAAELTEAERKSRKLSGCRYTARLAGAIHAVEIEGYLTF